MRSLENYLDRIYTDFEDEVNKMDSLCALTSLNYQTRRLPKYTDIRVQQLYLLKYAYAYTYEYFLMYNKAVKALDISRKLSVVSLGCGAMTDYMGLVSLKDSRPLEIAYTGVDPVDWSYKPVTCAQDIVDLNMGTTAGAYFGSRDELDADIYMFPKSISELSMEEVAFISDCFRFKKNKKDRFAICVSLRNSPVHRQEDLKKTDILQSAVLAGGYMQGAGNRYYFTVPEDVGIKKYEKNYNYPDRALGILKELGSRCLAKNFCRCQSQCMAGLNRYPVLKTKEICYIIMTFERSCEA